MKIINFDCIPKGEPIAKLLPGYCNMGGFHIAGRGESEKIGAIITTGGDMPSVLEGDGLLVVERANDLIVVFSTQHRKRSIIDSTLRFSYSFRQLNHNIWSVNDEGLSIKR